VDPYVAADLVVVPNVEVRTVALQNGETRCAAIQSVVIRCAKDEAPNVVTPSVVNRIAMGDFHAVLIVVQGFARDVVFQYAVNRIAMGDFHAVLIVVRGFARDVVIRSAVNQIAMGDFHAVPILVRGVARAAVLQFAVNQRAATRDAMGVLPNEVRQVHPNGALRVAHVVHQSLGVVPDVSPVSVLRPAWLLVVQQSAQQEYCLPDSACCLPPAHCDVRSDPGAQDAARSRLVRQVQDDLLRR
jgi:hypothetical protein